MPHGSSMAELRNPASEELNDGHIEVTWDFKHNTEQYVPRTHARISSWRAGTGYGVPSYLHVRRDAGAGLARAPRGDGGRHTARACGLPSRRRAQPAVPAAASGD